MARIHRTFLRQESFLIGRLTARLTRDSDYRDSRGDGPSQMTLTPSSIESTGPQSQYHYFVRAPPIYIWLAFERPPCTRYSDRRVNDTVCHCRQYLHKKSSVNSLYSFFLLRQYDARLSIAAAISSLSRLSHFYVEDVL